MSVSTGVAAAAARKRGYQEYAQDDEDWDEPSGGLVPGLLGSVLGAVGRITDLVVDIVPSSISRGVVDLSVKAGLALVVLGFARSLLSLALTIGTIVLGLYIASKVLGGGNDDSRGFDSPASGRRRSPTQWSSPLLPGSSRNDDLADVWFERRGSRQPQRRKSKLLPPRQKSDGAAQPKQRQQGKRDVREW